MSRFTYRLQSLASLGLMALLLPTLVGAQTLFRFEVDAGGDELAYAQAANGDTESIYAGEGLYMSIGGRMPLQPQNLSLDMSIGYKFDAVTADNGELYWSTIPIELILHNQMRQLHFGMGVALHLNPTLDGTGQAAFLDHTFDSSFGMILEGGVELFNNNTFGLRFVSISYRTSGVEVDGDHVGLFWQAAF